MRAYNRLTVKKRKMSALKIARFTWSEPHKLKGMEVIWVSTRFTGRDI